MSQIDIRHLQAALAIADELSFSRAAIRLNLTQPGLTKQIQDSERYLGVILFERNSQGVELTDAGRVFVEHARASLFHLDRAVHLTRAAANGAEMVLNLGTSPYIDPYLVSTLLSVRLSLFPRLRVHAHSNFSHELTRQVMSGELDVALATAGVPNANLNFLEVANHSLYVIMRAGDELTTNKSIELADCNNRVWILFSRHVHPMLYDRIGARADELGVHAREVHHVTTAEEAAHLIVQHDGVSFLTRTGSWRVALNGIAMRPLSESTIVAKTVLVTRSDDRSRLTSEYVRAAMKKLRQREELSQLKLTLVV